MFAALPDDARTRALRLSIVRGCGALVGTRFVFSLNRRKGSDLFFCSALSLLQSVGAAFAQQADFLGFAGTPWGAAVRKKEEKEDLFSLVWTKVLAELLGAVVRSRPAAGAWEPVVAGLFEALAPLLPAAASLVADRPERFLLVCVFYYWCFSRVCIVLFLWLR